MPLPRTKQPARKTDRTEEKESKKDLYKVEFWQQNNIDHRKPPITFLGAEYVRANSESQALLELKKRARKNARLLGRKEDHELIRRLYNEEVSLVVKKTFDFRPIDKERKLEDEKRQVDRTWCQECGKELDDDFCQDCGWRRQSWLEKALSKQGKDNSSIER